jgi:predicted TPR repeat methyltransferase
MINLMRPGGNSGNLADPRDQALVQEIAACVQLNDLVSAQNRYAILLSRTSDAVRLAPARVSLGLIEQRRGNPQAALALYALALAVDRQNPQLMLQLGLTHFELAQFEEAERYYRSAIRLEPRLPRAHYNLGVLLQKKRKLTAACRAFEVALVHQPRFPEALNNLGNALTALRDFTRAEKCYRDAIAINEAFFYAHHGLGVLLLEMQRREEALLSFQATVQHNHEYLPGWLDLAECQMQTGDIDAAKKSINIVLSKYPQHSIARYRLALYTGAQPDAMPPELVTHIYAGMAATFDEHLVGRLGYRTPMHMKTALKPWLDRFASAQDTPLHVIDLGCGTGLFGVQIRPLAAHLIGIDLSSAMLDAARARGIYDELAECDAEAFLKKFNGNADLIAATDVLIYIGNLASLFTAVTARLSTGGAFAFSIETPDDLTDGIRLQPSGRFAHSAQYIAQLAAVNALHIITREATTIRSEDAQPVKGYLFVVEKTEDRMTGKIQR